MGKEKEKHKRIARERVKTLFKEAGKTSKKYSHLADRYVELARKIAMKTKLKMPKRLKRKYCKHCHAYFRHGVNCRVRISKNMVLYYCYNCKKYTRVPFRKEKSKKTSSS